MISSRTSGSSWWLHPHMGLAVIFGAGLGMAGCEGESALSLSPVGLPGSDTHVAIEPGQSIQDVVEAHPPGTTFVIRRGTHRQQQVVPKDRQLFIGEDGAVLDGELSSEFAFGGNARDVTLQNLTITRYRSDQAPRGAIGLQDATGWRLIDLVVTHNLVDGVTGRGIVEFRGGSYSWNGRTGISLTMGDERGESVVIDGVELAHNHHDQRFHGSGLWHNGGIKITRFRNVVIRNSHAHNNRGAGLWCDIDCRDVVFENNLVERNTHAGIFYEISTRAVIVGNTIRNNGAGGRDLHRAAVLVSSSSHVRVERNTLQNNPRAIVGRQLQRGSYRVEGMRVVGNKITGVGRYAGGIFDLDGDGRAYTSLADNRWNRNSYRGLPSRPFHWRGRDRTVAQWQAEGHDVEGSF